MMGRTTARVFTWVGRTARALTLGTILVLRDWMMGRTKAKVLPLPVGADTQISQGLNKFRFGSKNVSRTWNKFPHQKGLEPAFG
jgi:hypothetical protein